MVFTRKAFLASGAIAALGLLPALIVSPAVAAPLDPVSYGPGTYSLPVPAGVCSAQAVVAGAAGGSAIPGAGNVGGAGSSITGIMPVRTGDTLDIAVGGAGAEAGTGGSNGGGIGGPSGGHPGAGGGGFSQISSGATLLILAGGGGGSGGGHTLTLGAGGAAGVPTGAGIAPGDAGMRGDDSGGVPGGGGGGGDTAPGTGGVHTTQPSLDGKPGVGTTGGAGGTDPSLDSGGGGGGGYFGGGGGASTTGDGVTGGGGGGGASYVAEAVEFVSAASGSNAPGTNGSVQIEWGLCDYDLSVAKQASAQVYENGDPVDYTISVTNHGPDAMGVDLPVRITDSRFEGATITAATSSSGAPVACDPAIGQVSVATTFDCWVDEDEVRRGLSVDEILSITYSQTLTGTESIANVVSVEDRGSAEDNTASVTLDPAAPALELVKSVDRERVAAAGDAVAYSFAVTNTGNIALNGVTIAEDAFSGSGELGEVTCPAESLGPDASMVCTANYTATQADVDAGELTNTASAHAVTPAGNLVASEPSDAQVEADQLPKLELVKSADRKKITAPGDVVRYAFAVTNAGNVTVRQVSIVEESFSGAGKLGAVSCPDEPLAPGASLTCTASYTATATDLQRSSLTNTARASARTLLGAETESNSSSAEVLMDPPAKPLAKTGGASASPGSALALALLLCGGAIVGARALSGTRRASAR